MLSNEEGPVFSLANDFDICHRRGAQQSEPWRLVQQEARLGRRTWS
jgi:hypothetical protein